MLRKDVPRDGVCISGMFVYTTKHNSSKACHAKSGSIFGRPTYVRCSFRVKGFQEAAGACGDASAPTAQLVSLISFVEAIAYTKWNF